MITRLEKIDDYSGMCAKKLVLTQQFAINLKLQMI